MYGVLTVFLGF